MRILLVNQDHASFGGPGGAERSVQTLAEHYAATGHHCTFVSVARAAYSRDVTESGIHSVRDIAGVRTILIARRGRATSHADLLMPIVLAERPDVVHTNVFHKAPQLWIRLAGSGVPVVHSLREYKLMCDRNMFEGGADCGAAQCADCRLASDAAREASARVHGVVGISPFTLERHLGAGFFEGVPVRRVIPNSVRPARACAPRGAPPAGAPRRIGFLGRLHPSKGVDLLLDAMAAVAPGTVSLRLAGDLQHLDISARLEALGRIHDVAYEGFVAADAFLAGVDALVVPSIWQEPFGRVAVEAMAHGVPVIASRRGGLGGIVEPGRTGWLFDPEQPRELVRAIETVRDLAPSRWAAMSAAACEAAGAYAPEVVGEAYLDVYREARDVARARDASAGLRGLYQADAARRDVLATMRSRRSRRERQPLRVVVVTGEFPKRSETFVLNHITGLLDLGCDVRIAHTRAGDLSQAPAEHARYGLAERSFLLTPEGASQDVVSHLARQAGAVGGQAGPALAAEIRDRLTAQHGAQRLLEHARDTDVIHCHFGHRPSIVYPMLDAAGIDIPVVCSFHGIDMSEHVERMGPDLYRKVARRLRKALPVSEFFARRLVALGFDPKDVQIHRVGVDCSRFAFRERRRAPDEPLRLASVGRFVEKKGFRHGVLAVDALRRRRPDIEVRYAIAGDGQTMGEVRALAGELGLGDRVRLMGSIPHSEVVSLLDASHALVVPSVTGSNGDMEGVPTVTMEAQASGLPVVSTWHSGISEAVLPGVTGLLSEERDAEGMATNLEALHDTPEIGCVLGRAGRVHTLHEFNIERQNRRILKLYEAIATAAD